MRSTLEYVAAPAARVARESLDARAPMAKEGDIMSQDVVDEHIKTVYARFGIALYFAQVLEHGLANALMFVEFLPRRAGEPVPRQQWEAEFDLFLNEQFKKTGLERQFPFLQVWKRCLSTHWRPVTSSPPTSFVNELKHSCRVVVGIE